MLSTAGMKRKLVANGARPLPLLTMMSALPEEYRQAVVLRYWYDMSYEEIAEAQQTSVSAVKSRLFRARRILADASLERGMVPAAAEAEVAV